MAVAIAVAAAAMATVVAAMATVVAAMATVVAAMATVVAAMATVAAAMAAVAVVIAIHQLWPHILMSFYLISLQLLKQPELLSHPPKTSVTVIAIVLKQLLDVVTHKEMSEENGVNQ